MEKRFRTGLFISGIILLGFMPIVFATFFLLVDGAFADLLWVLGVLSVVDGMILLIWYGLAERNARKEEVPQPVVDAQLRP